MSTQLQSPQRRHGLTPWICRAVALSSLGMLFAQVVTASASNLTVNPSLVSSWTYSGAPALQPLLAEDNFSQSGTLATATIGGPWSQVGTSWISGPTARTTVPGTSQAYVTLPGVVDGRLDISMSDLASRHAGVVIRGSALAAIVVVYRYTGPATFPEIRLVFADSLVNGLGVLAAPVAFAQVDPTPTATMSVAIEDGTVTVLWNGKSTLSYALTPLQRLATATPLNTHWGLWVESGASPLFDNFRIQGTVLS